MMLTPIELTCAYCKKVVIKYGKHNKRKYCSDACGAAGRGEIRSAYPSLATPTVGAISELRVATDLLIKGFPVFRALSPACPCDLAVLLNNKLIRIEVKTAYKVTSGAIMYPKRATDIGKFDILALCLPGEIVYRPPLKSLSV